MKFILFVLTIATTLVFVCGCRKNNNGSGTLVGTHVFSGPCKYIDTGFFGPHAEVDTSETVTAFIRRPASNDSSNFIYIPVEIQGEPLGGVYFTFTDSFNLYPPDELPVVIQIQDTLLTIPHQLPVSGFGCIIQGSGSLVGRKLTISYQTFYRGYYKYSTVVTNL